MMISARLTDYYSMGSQFQERDQDDMDAEWSSGILDDGRWISPDSTHLFITLSFLWLELLK